MDKQFWIDSKSVANMEMLATDAGEVETGGILMGYVAESGEGVVTLVTGPGPNAKHSARSFTPDDRFHRAEMKRIYDESGGMITYLGDWHSHPAGGVWLSWKDRITLGKIGRVHSPMGHRPFMVLLARNGNDWEVAPFQLVRPHVLPFVPAKISFVHPNTY